LRLRIPSPSYDTVTKELDGGGVIVVDRVLKPRNLVAEFYSKASGYRQSLELRDLLYEMLGNGRALYVSESEIPMRRWRVYLDEWTPERIDVKSHKFEIPLFSETGTAESVAVIKNKYASTTFRFNNDGNVVIDPRIHSETEVEFTGSSSNLIIRNLTTGDEWSWVGDTLLGDRITLKGVRSLKNDVSIFGQTNKKLITLNPGWNDFQIVGVIESEFKLNIRTRFYFL
jgi:hypothetical protein